MDSSNGAGDDRSGNKKQRNLSDPVFADDYLELEESEFSDDVDTNLLTATGRIIPVAVKGSDTIDKIKLKIQAEQYIPFDQFEILFKQKSYKNTFANFPLDNESDLTLTDKSRDVMNIFIKNLEGKLIYSFQVKPSDTISNVKAKMCDFQHVLIFNGVALEDSGTIADFNIIDGSTLIGVNISKKKMELFVNTFTGNTISLLVTPTDTIANVKSEIVKNARFPVDEQVLIFNEMVLGDSGTLCDFHIKRKSTLTLMRRSSGSIQIFIKTLSGETININVHPSHTIGKVKSKIQEKINIPHDEQELIFNEMVLDNIDTLDDLHINGDSTLTLMRVSTGDMHIFIDMLDRKTINLKVKPSNTVYNVKSKILDTQGFPRCQLILLFNGRHLHDGATLADYHIDNESTVDCQIIVRGD